MKNNYNFLAFTFGPIGDTLMMLALFDDILSIDSNAKFTIISRRNIGLIRDLAQKYDAVEVKEIPSGLKSVPFYLSLLSRRQILLALGVAGAYSVRIKLFFLALSLLPGNKTLGFNDRGADTRGWLPLDRVLQFDGNHLIIDNFRRLLEDIYPEELHAKISGRPPHVALATSLPQLFTLQRGSYIASNYFSNISLRSLPLHRLIELTACIVRKFPSYKVVLLGGPADAAAIEKISREVPSTIPMPGLLLTEAAGVIDRAALYVGVDTGITHLACIMQQKSVVIRHNRFPTWSPTYNPSARELVNSRRCECKQGGRCEIEKDGVRYSKCMYDISDDFIVDSIRLGLSAVSRHIPLFAGVVDQNR
jgi:ADP-heptose:LPS heptosyltransferase